ncbi:AEC family transporter [Gracilibacillus alcaliphilus]|uniref:AEC family transporter n=1 Tax=Gracilibacillus alcaliphilus TaxID=1401441 RepID=UPI001956C0BA|nr:AEC family transporter [Gracilibacillus alcaliphilus]MBM7676490.1 putative permease [Gracilibacillus alcaliphilus]
MSITTVSLTVCMMGIIILLGVIIARRIQITFEAKQLFMSVIINIAVPCIILNGVFNTEINDTLLMQVLKIFLISVIFNLLAIGFALISAKILDISLAKAKQLALLSAIGNTGFIGIPLCAAIFGPVGGLLAAVFDAGLDVVVFSVGIYLLQNQGGFQWRHLKSLINMPLFAVSFGLLFAASGLDAPALLKELTAMLSGLAAPLAMLYIGFLLLPFFQRKQALYYPTLWLPLLLKLLVIPISTIVVLSILPLDMMIKQLLVLLTCMPTFTLASVLFSRYTSNEQQVVITTVTSTILSLATIPLISWISIWLL